MCSERCWASPPHPAARPWAPAAVCLWQRYHTFYFFLLIVSPSTLEDLGK